MCVAKYQHILAAHNSGKNEKDDPIPSENSSAPQNSYEGSTEEGSTASPSSSTAADLGRAAAHEGEGEGEEEGGAAVNVGGNAARDISEQVEASMKFVGPFLCELLIDYSKGVLSKILVGADGRSLISEGKDGVWFHPHQNYILFSSYA